MKSRKESQKHQSKKHRGSNKSTNRLLKILLILLLFLILAGVIYWYLPQIANYFQYLWKTITKIFGVGLIIIPFILVLLLIIVLAGKSKFLLKYWHEALGIITLMIFSWSLLSYLKPELGGDIGKKIISDYPARQLIIIASLFILAIILIIPKLFWRSIYVCVKLSIAGLAKLFRKIGHSLKVMTSKKTAVEQTKVLKTDAASTQTTDEAVIRKYVPIVTSGGWKLPPVDLLDTAPEAKITETDLQKRAEQITEALLSYGVEAKVVQINPGPTVTQFGVEPGWDIKYREIRERDKDGTIKIKQQEISRTRVKVERISSLANDLALALAAPSIRIEAPVPGKSIVGIEVPNTNFGSVNLRSIIESSTYQKILSKSKLAIPLGKGAGGEVAAADLTKMPHLLIAGSTGSGKTVFINSIICSLLFYNTPDDLNFIMIDPKRVELVNFNEIPHLIAPVVVDTGKAVTALRWLVEEMDNRYKKFAEAGARNIEAYNKNKPSGEALPYIVLIIDELADLMMTAFGEVEQYLCRLAQLSRATGIHLIVATQRPSVDVITGLIKANFPTRISFSLTSQIDSRTILDSPGAEKLLGRGDMLYMPTDASKPKRLQGPLLTDSEIDRLVKFWGEQKRQETAKIDFTLFEQKIQASKVEEEEPLLEEARALAKTYSNISASFLQRKLKIGYPRAARIMEKLKEEGF